MIEFKCPSCHAGISAEVEASGAAANCPSCDQEIVVPGVVPIPAPPQRPRPFPPVELQNEDKRVTPTRKPIWSLIAVLAVGLIGVWVWHTQHRGESLKSVSRKAEKQSPAEASPGARFWMFTFGEERKRCAEVMKDLNSQGKFEDLSSGVVMSGWLPGMETISGVVRQRSGFDLDGILSRPCTRIALHFKEERLVGIELGFGFKSALPSDFARVLRKDMQRFLGVHLGEETLEDDVGNRTSASFLKLEC